MKSKIVLGLVLAMLSLNSMAHVFSDIVLQNQPYRAIIPQELLNRITTTPGIRHIPVPYIGTYQTPYEGVFYNALNPFNPSAFLYIKAEGNVLKIATIQAVVSTMVEASSLNYNMHHLLYPDYEQPSDSSNNLQSYFSLRSITVNGVAQPDQTNLQVIVHDGLFSPSLPQLVAHNNDPFVIRARIQLPAFNTHYTHPYAGFSEIQALNIVLTDQTWLGDIVNAESVEEALARVPEQFRAELIDFMS